MGAWLRGGRRSSARVLGAEHPTDGAGAWEPPGPPSPPRLCRETEAGSARGDEGVVLGGENLPLLAAPQEETLKAQPVWRNGAWTHHQHLSPVPPEAQGATGWRLLQCCAGSRHRETRGSLLSPTVLVPNSAPGQWRGL